ncbi:E2/E3 hybrid ubiquitin-protein ligase ube2o [Tulasnella sp. JGI-2019a]|nr:E2/E3 hybrid ubiquitin-protein ligase ube2o [Tulasnella sp. JGI-2019a]
MVKLLKEYRMPSSCLPDSITLCAYEDCTDLLRSLIMDPEGAVCEGAPFVIDWFLDKTFPQTPPIAHF